MLELNFSGALSGMNVYDFKRDCCYESIDNEFASNELKTAQKESIDKVFAYFKGYLSMGIKLNIAQRCLNAKIDNVLKAKTVKEAREFGDLCLPMKKHNLQVYGEGYVPEEELIALSIASKKGSLTKAAQERYISLYEMCFCQKEVICE